ncbi:competence type IV pilus minor pilin ComGF [Enterococcus rotai]|uniref:competence type IV pilus minor pilin ComGF n=1 Tax=Enterococcus rotai TaxID=118060 RepID=UPI0032B40182
MEKRALYLRKNNRQHKFSGFTLIECLLALLVLSIICLLFSASIKNAVVVTSRLKSEREKEWQIFMIQLENEVKSCHYEKTQSNKIILTNTKNNKKVWIEHKLGKIVKVDNGGYQPLLTEVKQAIFKEEGKYVMIEVTFENDVCVAAKWIIAGNHKHER